MNLALAALSLLLLQGAQTQDRPAIEGFVVKIGTSEPVTRARVVMTKQPARPGELFAVTTGGDGKFVFRNLAPGEYRIFVQRTGYLRAEYGQRVAQRPGVPITLLPGQTLKDIVVPMTPTGVISGRVTDRFGEPVVNANVQAHKYTYLRGKRTLGTYQSTRTNDVGEYRLYWLPPGSWVVSAIPTEAVRSEGGSVLIEGGPGSPIQLNAGMPTGPLRIGGQVAAAMGLIDATELGESYLPVYFPGTTDAGGAAPIDLRPGAGFGGVDLIVAETRAVKIRGSVVSSITGQPAPALVYLVQRQTAIASSAPRSSADLTGTFEFRAVNPGSYDLVATTQTPPPPPPLPGAAPAAPTAPARSAMVLTARVPLEIGTADIDNLVVTVTPGYTIEGRITIEGRDPNQNTPDVAGIGVELRPEVVAGGIAMIRTPSRPDGTFTLQGVSPVAHQLFLTGTPPNSYMTAARIGSIDLLSTGLRIEGEPSGPLQIQLSLNGGTLDATVLDENRKPLPAVPVVLVPDPARRLRYDNYRNATTDAMGRVRIDRIIPGEYKVFAWEDVESNAWEDADFIRFYEDRGRAIRFVEGGKENIQVTVIPPK